MAFIPVANVVQVQLFGREDGQTTVNDLYFILGVGGITPVNMGALLDAVCAWYAGSIAPRLSSAWSFERGHAQDLSAPNSISLDNALHTAVGGVGGAPAPNNVSFAISFRTRFSGRSFRGRNYLPGIPLFDITGNTMNVEPIGQFLAAYEELLPGGGVLPAGWAWVVVSRFTAGAPRAAGLATNVEAVIATDNVLDSERRRLPGRGS